MGSRFSGFKVLMTEENAKQFIPILRGLKHVLAVRRAEGLVKEAQVAFDHPMSREDWSHFSNTILSALLAQGHIEPVPVVRDLGHACAGLPMDLELQKHVTELKSQATAEIDDLDKWAHRQRQLAYASRKLLQAFDPKREEELYGPQRWA